MPLQVQPSNQKVIVKVPGKVLLFGEYGVLEGAPGVAVGINRFARITLQTKSYLSSFQSPAQPITQIAYLELQNQIITTQFSHLKHLPSLDAFHFDLNTEQFYSLSGKKIGIGSSAAITIGIVASLYEWLGFSISNHKKEIFDVAFRAHKIFQEGLGSGIDVLTSTYGGICIVNHSLHSIDSLPCQIRLVYTNQEQPTIPILKKYKELQQEAKNAALQSSELAKQFVLACIQSNIKTIIDLAHQSISHYEELSKIFKIPLLSKEHFFISQIAKQCGGAAKPSGAGGGDLTIVFFQSEEEASWFDKKIPSSFSVFPLEIDFQGVSLSFKSN